MKRPLTPRETPSAEVRATAKLEFEAVLTGPNEALGEAHAAFDEAVRTAYAACDRLGVQVVQARGQMRGLSQEELLSVLPRKWHLKAGEGHRCETPYVSAKFITEEPAKVTCKLCLRKMREDAGG